MRKIVLAAVLLALSAGPAGAEFPDKPLKIIVPFPAGRVTDLVARIVGDGLRAKFNQPVVVENRPGASGLIGMDALLKATPDGYTLLVGGIGSHGIPPAVVPNYPYDVNKDFTALAMVTEFVNVLVVNKDLPAANPMEFVTYAKARPGQLNYGLTSIGASNHMTAELFMLRTGTKIVGVPFGQSGNPIVMLRANDVQVIFENLPTVIGHIKSGAIKALAVTSPYRTEQLPAVPTMQESGFPDFSVTSWIGMYGPGTMPSDRAKVLGDAILAIAREPASQEKLKAAGFEPSPRSGADYAKFQAGEVERWKGVVKAANIKAQ